MQQEWLFTGIWEAWEGEDYAKYSQTTHQIQFLGLMDLGQEGKL